MNKEGWKENETKKRDYKSQRIKEQRTEHRRRGKSMYRKRRGFANKKSGENTTIDRRKKRERLNRK